jgi:hypothetical protein
MTKPGQAPVVNPVDGQGFVRLNLARAAELLLIRPDAVRSQDVQ